MGFIKNLLNRSPTQTRYELVTDNGNGFYMWDGKLYRSDIVRACIKPKVKALGKLVAKHIRDAKEGLQVNPEPYIKLLLEEPNPYMSGQMLMEKMATQLALNNNAFALIVKDDNGYPVEIYHIPCISVQVVYDKQMLIYLKFTMVNGRSYTFPYSDVIHIRDDFNENEIFGTSPIGALKSIMEIVNTTDQGIVNAIKNSNIIRWLLKYEGSIREEDLKKKVQEFINSYLSIKDGQTTGAAGIDGKMDAKQVEPKDYVPNATQQDRTITRAYNFFHTNEKIIQSKCTEEEWNSYYELEVEPIAIQFGNEYSRKLFSRRERAFGNSIVFESSNLQCASLSSKLQLVQMVDRGALTPNEWRATMNMAPIEGGNKPIRRLDTQIVNEVKTLINKMDENNYKEVSVVVLNLLTGGEKVA